MRIHFIGIGGVGVSGLAEVALAQGHRVTGSDRTASAITERLAARGAAIRIGHSAEAIGDWAPDLVVYSAAIPASNPELAMAHARGIPTVSRSEYLGKAMDEAAPPRVAVAGTHGKTTTTSMVGAALVAAGLDPTVLIGGDYAAFGGNVRIGSGPFVTEACEAFRSFLDLQPDVAVITNIEPDHLDCYGDFDHVLEAFAAFVQRIRPGGTLVLWADDPHADAFVGIGTDRGLRVLRYGLGEKPDRDMWADEPASAHGVTGVTVRMRGAGGAVERLGALTLGAPGRHNILNGMAALGVAMACGADILRAFDGLQGFGGVERRFDVLGSWRGATVVDDYAHHPTEIRATMAAARERFEGRRLIAVFQPHLYSRTRDLLDDFAQALAGADAVVVTGIYAAREEPIPGVDAALLSGRVAAVAPDVTLLTEPDRERIPSTLEHIVRKDDVILMLGAGDIREVGERLVATEPSTRKREA
ncbi:MAG: UDP-N-acetylmuramate--L-alanine ligase [Chthonomonadales bacterium]|nr:UDP-N-acetylmuramate--L-alanine ligase [Chthonomonadales bacterium]